MCVCMYVLPNAQCSIFYIGIFIESTLSIKNQTPFKRYTGSDGTRVSEYMIMAWIWMGGLYTRHVS